MVVRSVFFRTLYVGGEVLGTVNSIFVLQPNCTVVEKNVYSRQLFYLVVADYIYLCLVCDGNSNACT